MDGPGIYRITCLATGKFYIGSAVNVCKRWRTHRKQLRKGSHFNNRLQRAWTKYGEESFSFAVVESTPRDVLITREQWWITSTRCCERGVGFNLSPTAGSILGHRMPLASVKNRSLRWIVTLPDGREEPVVGLKTWCRRNSLNFRTMAGIAKGRYYSHRGHKCRTADMSRASFATMQSKMKKRSAENRLVGRRRAAETRAGEWVITHPDGSEEAIKNMHAFCKAHGLRSAMMSLIAQGKKYMHRGYRCRPAGAKPAPRSAFRKPVFLVTAPSGEQWTLTNLKAFCRERELPPASMYSVAYGKQNGYHGWSCEKLATT